MRAMVRIDNRSKLLNTLGAEVITINETTDSFLDRLNRLRKIFRRYAKQ